MRSRLAFAFLLLCLTLPALADKPIAPNSVTGAVLVNAEQVVELILSTPQLVTIDSRHPEEFVKGHIEGALNLLDTDTTAESLARLTQGKESPVLFYCNGERCLRSSHAAKTAVSLGYRKVYWFRGGWSEWIEKQMPVKN